jgi:DNA-binding LytR/AlgR family response regulator
MKLKIAIVDDEKEQTDYLAGLVTEWAKIARAVISIRTFPSSEAFLFEYEEDRVFDVLLLDIEMGDMDGVSLARRVRKEDSILQIVFITGYFEYVSDGYEVSALHYLLKPATKEKLFPVLDRATENLAARQLSLVISTAGQTLRIPLHDIVYVEASSNYSKLTTLHAEYRPKIPLSELEKGLDDTFFRCGRSFIVGLRHIRKISKTTVTIEGGLELPLSRGRYDDINRALIERL